MPQLCAHSDWLAARWVRNFLAMSLPPALIVFFFSAWFLTSSIDSWFDVRVEAALADSLELGQEFLDTRTLEVRIQLREVAGELSVLQEDGDREDHQDDSQHQRPHHPLDRSLDVARGIERHRILESFGESRRQLFHRCDHPFCDA